MFLLRIKKKGRKMKKRNFVLRGFNAFTLAEVLITLVIIGVIGALTVPALIQNTQKQEFVSALKKTYSTLSNASQQIIAEEGTPRCDEGGWACSIDDVYNMYKKHLNNIKDCGKDAGCMKQISAPGGYKYLNGGIDWDWETSKDFRRLILADGTQIMFFGIDTSCAGGDWTVNNHNVCTNIAVDVNGEKAPNTFGRDMFGLSLRETGIYPMGCETAYCVNSRGHGCACKVLTEGAMNY